MLKLAMIAAALATSGIAIADQAAAPAPMAPQAYAYPTFDAEAQKKAFEAQQQSMANQQKTMAEQAEKVRAQQQAMVDAQNEYQKTVMEAQRKLNDAQLAAMDKLYGVQR